MHRQTGRCGVNSPLWINIGKTGLQLTGGIGDKSGDDDGGQKLSRLSTVPYRTYPCAKAGVQGLLIIELTY